MCPRMPLRASIESKPLADSPCELPFAWLIDWPRDAEHQRTAEEGHKKLGRGFHSVGLIGEWNRKATIAVDSRAQSEKRTLCR